MTRFSLSVACLLLAHTLAAEPPQHGGELRFSLSAAPKTLDPLMVDDEPSLALQYLTNGVLIRFNRRTQTLEGELATSWKKSSDGKSIRLDLRRNIRFSDGAPFTSEDVAYTFRKLMDPALHSPIGDSFRSGEGGIRVETPKPDQVTLTFAAPIGSIERLLDQVPIVSAKSAAARLGPFVLKENKSGAYLLLERNGNYWKKDAQGRSLPYLATVRLVIQQNRETEMLRFRRGELDLINSLDAKLFDRLQSEEPQAARDLGPSLDSEFLWFNQAASSPLPPHKKAWFTSQTFRRALSGAINRADLCRLAMNGHAVPAAGPVSPANQFWFNREIKPHPFQPQESLRALRSAGFRNEGGVLKDAAGNVVEFSIITNAGNLARARMAALIQQDLGKLGIRINVVPLDFPSLLERITRTFNYEACLLGFVNIEMDPNAQMNVWLSSASNHPWNPKQPKPATEWEAEIDKLMTAQASAADAKVRKASFDRVQKIVSEQAPILYLLHKNHLVAVSTKLTGADPRALPPQTFWNVEWISLPPTRIASTR